MDLNVEDEWWYLSIITPDAQVFAYDGWISRFGPWFADVTRHWSPNMGDIRIVQRYLRWQKVSGQIVLAVAK